jgi:tripartite-type tricarboxylate transporter receptor subunit TctC
MKPQRFLLTLVLTVTVISLILSGCSPTPTAAPAPTAVPAAPTTAPAAPTKAPVAPTAAPVAPTAVPPAPTAAPASKWPEGSVTLVMGQGAGGAVDTNVRGIAPYLQKALGVSVVVNNMTGNNGLTAANYVYGVKPDGYNLLIGTSGVALVAQVMADQWKPGKPLEDAFIPLYSWIYADGNGVFVNKDAPWKTMADLAAEAQKRPIKFAIGGGWTSTDAVMAQMIRQAYGGNWVIIPTDSGAQVLSGLLGGQYDAGSTSPSGSAADPSTLRVLAVSMQARSPRWPDTPTFIELGKPTCSINQIIGAMAPTGTPPDVVAKLVAAFDKARNDPDYIAWAKKTDQLIGDKGWDAATYSAAMKTYTKNMGPVIPLLLAELQKAQGITTTPTAAPTK